MPSDKQEAIVEEMEAGACVPRLSTLAKNLSIPTSTIKYNIEKLEDDNTILGYTVVTDPKKRGFGYEGFTLLNLNTESYADPEEVADSLAEHREIQTVAIVTGEYELLLEVREESMASYFSFLKRIMSSYPIRDVKTISSLKVVKSSGIVRNQD